MRIMISQEGGIAYFPGLSKPTVIDDHDLSKQDQDALAGLVSKARFFERGDARSAPTARGAPQSRGADLRTVSLTLDDGQRKRTVRVTEPIADDGLRALVEFAQAKANDMRRKAT